MQCLLLTFALNAKQLLSNTLLPLPHLGLEQDIFDVVVIPVLAALTYKIDFFTWVCFARPFVHVSLSHYE